MSLDPGGDKNKLARKLNRRKTMSNKELAPQKTKAVALAAQFEDDAGVGFEQADANAYAIPFLTVLQSMSPQCKKSDGAYIKGAEEGMLYNSVTQEIYDGEAGVTAIPCYFKRSYIKWAPRESGGGFRGELMPSDPQIAAGKVNAEGRMIDSEGNILADTRTHYVLMLDKNGGYQPAVISLSSSQIKKSRNWMSKMNGIKLQRADGSHFTPAMFSHMYKITTVPESNDKGSWFGLKVETIGPVNSTELYQAAKSFRDAVSSGEVKEQIPHAATTDADDYADREGEF
jgi:hypothetical protein